MAKAKERLKTSIYDYICKNGPVSRDDILKRFNKFDAVAVKKHMSNLKSSSKKIQNERIDGVLFYSSVEENKELPFHKSDKPTMSIDSLLPTKESAQPVDKNRVLLDKLAVDLRKKKIMEDGMDLMKKSIFDMFTDLERQLNEASK